LDDEDIFLAHTFIQTHKNVFIGKTGNCHIAQAHPQTVAYRLCQRGIAISRQNAKFIEAAAHVSS
jgi:hypothetical protein